MSQARVWVCLGSALALWAAAARAEDGWRPVDGKTPFSAGPQRVQPGKPVISLGAPIVKANPAATQAESSRPAVVQTAKASPALSAPVTKTSVVRGQGPEGVGAEEAYNCGVVTEGPPRQGGLLGAGWLGGLGDNAGGFLNDYGLCCRGTFESDHAFDSFISPVTNPFFFEDPRSLTELRPIFMHQKFPGGNPVFGGGDAQFWGLQGRLALSERLSVVMSKLGYITIDSAGPVAGDDGFAEFIIGPKYTFWRDDVTGTLMAFGVNFEFAGGSAAFQDTGDGAVTPYLSAGQKLGNWHFLGTLGHRFGFDNDRADMLFLSLHADYSIVGRIYPLVEFNWYHYTDSGNRTAADFDGRDLFSLGSTDVTGKDVLTLGLGGRFKFTEAFQIGAAYEFPISDNKDLIDYRVTVDLIFRY